MALILFLQHRTVWVTATLAFIVNYFIIKYKSEAKITYSFFFNFGFVALIFLVLSFLTISEFKPEFFDILSDRARDIIEPSREGSTSSWRLLQYNSYLPFIGDNLWIGMRYDGFELPIQFYHPEAGIPYFEDDTGHHFHSYYVDILFYFGIVGIFLQIMPTLWFFIRKILTGKSLNVEQVSLLVFSLSGFVFGISYNLPSFYFAFLGLTFYFLDQKESPNDKILHIISETLPKQNILTKA
jgi:O-antigen ligase